jgi:hypothetical protein
MYDPGSDAERNSDLPLPEQSWLDISQVNTAYGTPPNLAQDMVAQYVLSCLDGEVPIVLMSTGACYISLPSSCAVLRLNVRGQLQRIQRTPELLAGLRQLPLQTRGGIQRINCLEAEKVESWLAGLHMQGPTDPLREKIVAYHVALTGAIAALQAGPPMQEVVPTQGKDTPAPHETMQRVHAHQELAQQLLPQLDPELTDDLHEQRALLATLPGIASAPVLVTTSFQEDRAIREATLARTADWTAEPLSQRLRYIASNKIHVYLGDSEHPLSMAETLEKIRELGESTVLTARIILGLWNIRRYDEQLAKDGSAAIRVEDILELRGVQKHSRAMYPGSQVRRTDGYQWKHKQQVHRDIKLLELCHLRGSHTVIVKGKARQFVIDGPYLRVTSVKEPTSENEEDIIGYFVAPGAWINTYEEHGNLFLAGIDRRIFQLHPQNEQIALRIALFLTEHWRQHMRTGRYGDPITMQELLAASMVPIDRSNLTTRFAPRVEAALQRLCSKGVVGEARPLTPVDITKAQWGKDWLLTQWKILPPADMLPHTPTRVIEGSIRELDGAAPALLQGPQRGQRGKPQEPEKQDPLPGGRNDEGTAS